MADLVTPDGPATGTSGLTEFSVGEMGGGVLQGRRIALVVLSAVLALSSCDGRPGGAGDDAAFHPGEADTARSAQARDETKACAEDRGWHLGDLEVLVDDEGLLIRIGGPRLQQMALARRRSS